MNIDDDLLQRLVPINALPDSLRAQVRQSATILEPAANQPLFRRGDRDDATYYVLQGGVVLAGTDGASETVEAGSEAARHPLAPELPRVRSARAKAATRVLQVNRTLLDTCLFWTQATGEEKEEPVAESNAWINRLAGSPLFSRIPPENIQRVLTHLEAIHLMAGDTVIRQGETGDYYYVIQRGRCAVTRQAAGSGREMRLAELGPGDCFGEEALITDSRRNASVTMVTEGVLRRLSKDQFTRLVRRPLVRELSAAAARRLAAEPDVRWLDVRLPEEHARSAIRGSLNLPLARLRARMTTLERDRRYIVYCDSGRRSAAAAFLLGEQGFEAFHLSGGVMNHTRQPHGPAGKVLGTAREAQQRRLELARANRSVAVAARRSAHAQGIDQAAGESLERRPGGATDAVLEASLQDDRRRFHEAARATEKALQEAQQRRLDLAADTAILERLADEAISGAASTEHELRSTADTRLQAGEERLEQLYRGACAELEAGQAERERFEAEAAAAREALEREVHEAEAHLAEVERQRELAAAEVRRCRSALEHHDGTTGERRNALMAAELETRQRAQQELGEERLRLEREFAEVAARLEALRHERTEAEAARRLATDEAARLEAKDASAASGGSEAGEVGAWLDQEHDSLAHRLGRAREAQQEAEAVLDTLASEAGAAEDPADLDAAIQAQQRTVELARQEVASVETAQERLRITREIFDTGAARGEALEDSLRRRLAEELEEWLMHESEDEDRNRHLTTQLHDDLVQAQREALEAQRAEEEATATMMDEIHSQLDAGG